MPVPSNISSWEHLQDLFRLYHNKLVREEFSDLGALLDDDDINIPRSSLKYGCTLKDDDTSTMTLLRLWLFYVVLRKASDFHPPIYGIPADTFQQSVEFLPQIKLVFSQDLDSVPDSYRPVTAEVSYRLTQETSATLTESKARSIANKIKTEFATGAGYTWSKGKIILTYRRPDQGYNLQIYALNETEGREVINKILDLQNHTIDNDYLTIHEPKRPSLNIPTVATIYGKSRRKSRWRPTARVRFKYASLQIHGLPNDVILVDRSGYWRNPLVS